MSVETTEAPATRPNWSRVADVTRRVVAWLLLVCWLAVVAAIVVAGERETPPGDLQAAVWHGEVDEITVEGTLRNGVVHWQDGWLPRVTDLGVMAGSLEPGPGVDVHRVEPRRYAELGSWRVPSWVGGAWVFAAIGTFCLLVLGPQPWRATRWAWFWICTAAPPLGVLTFVLLGGGTGLWRPARPERRLTGGPAFALMVLLSAAASVLAAWAL